MARQIRDQSEKTMSSWTRPALVILVLVLVGLAGWGIQHFLSDADDSSAAAPQPTVGRPSQSAPSPTQTTPLPTAQGANAAWECQAELSQDQSPVEEIGPVVEDWATTTYSVIPLSDYGGCQKQPSGLRVGFSNSPAGSLMAAATYSVALDPSLSEEAAKDLEVAVSDTPDRERLAERAKRIRDGLEESTDGSTLLGSTLVGYSQNSYSKDAASYQLVYAITAANGMVQKVSGQVDLVWEEGDWKLDPASGTELINGAAYSGHPYVNWGPDAVD